MVVNGATAKLYLDGVFGASVPFPFASGLTFGFATYVDEAGNVARGYFDNAVLKGEEEACAVPVKPAELTAAVQGGNLVITWTGAGTLQAADAVGTSTKWNDITPAPSSPYSTPIAGQQKYYRLRQ